MDLWFLKIIKNFEIQNLKSLKHVKLECEKINLFIGETNVGKSNILESLAFLSSFYHTKNTEDYQTLFDFLRLEEFANLFYNNSIDEKIVLNLDDKEYVISYDNGELQIKNELSKFSVDFNGFLIASDKNLIDSFKNIKYYNYKYFKAYNGENQSKMKENYLYPPYGFNLFDIIYTNSSIRAIVEEIFESEGFRLVFIPKTKKFVYQKQIENTIVQFPIVLAPDTIQAVLFYEAAIESNSNSIIVFEEPESHMFPYYVTRMAKKISKDKNNQYFITTHNPYFLGQILSTNINDLGIFITSVENYETKVRKLSKEEIEGTLDLDLLLNLDFDKEK